MLQVFGTILDEELTLRGVVSPGAAACSEIMARVFERAAKREQPLTLEEVDEISKRST